MSWLGENLQILATMGSASAIYVLIRCAAKKDVKELGEKLGEKIDKVEQDLVQINLRLSRLEGSFEERRYWVSKQQETVDLGDK